MIIMTLLTALLHVGRPHWTGSAMMYYIYCIYRVPSMAGQWTGANAGMVNEYTVISSQLSLTDHQWRTQLPPHQLLMLLITPQSSHDAKHAEYSIELSLALECKRVYVYWEPRSKSITFLKRGQLLRLQVEKGQSSFHQNLTRSVLCS